MLSFTVWLANDYMRGVAELASNSLAIKLTQAGCEVATRKSKVLSRLRLRAQLQLRLAARRASVKGGT